MTAAQPDLVEGFSQTQAPWQATFRSAFDDEALQIRRHARVKSHPTTFTFFMEGKSSNW